MDKHRDFSQLTWEQKLELARAVFQRGSESHDAAIAAFRKVYPTATDEMITTAYYHIYVDGSDAALDFIAEAEMFLRDPDKDWLNTYDLLYHTYNWHMFQALLPEVTQDLLAAVDYLKRSVEGGADPKDVLKEINDLRDQIAWHTGLPQI